MLDYVDAPTIYFLLFLHLLIGGVAALIASRKGHSRLLWIFLGMIGGTPSLIASFMIKDRTKENPLNPS